MYQQPVHESSFQNNTKLARYSESRASTRETRNRGRVTATSDGRAEIDEVMDLFS
jgi:hypothetical protein